MSASRVSQKPILLGLALTYAILAHAAAAQTVDTDLDPSRDTYIVDSKGTAHYRNGVRICHVNCGRTAQTFPLPPPDAVMVPALAPLPPAADRALSADSYPRLPPALVQRPVPAPAQPAVRTISPPLIPAPVAPRAAALAQAAQQPAPAAPPKSGGLTKEQKALILNAGGVAAITAYGLGFWDYFQTSPKARSEGWFGRTSKNGGADKLGHFWSTYAVGHLFSYLYRWWDFDAEQANTLGAASSLGIQTLMELGDAFSGDYGFSYEDAIMNFAGAGAAYVLGKYPSLARKIDFRFEYRPQSFSDLTNDFLTNYDNQRYLIALKLDGFDVFHNSYLSYLELQAGYYARGYEEWNPGDPDTRRRHLYFGVGFNVSKLVQQFADVGIFDYVQIPYTSGGFSKGLD